MIVALLIDVFFSQAHFYCVDFVEYLNYQNVVLSLLVTSNIIVLFR